MGIRSRTRMVSLLWSIVLLLAGSTRSALATPDVIFETFGQNGVAALDPATGRGIGNLGVTATNIVAGAGTVYFESGNTIDSSTSNLVGLNTVITNNLPATGLALDAADGILYETFGANGVSALNLNTGRGLGNLGVSATNIVYGNGKVYFESGNTIDSSTSNLVGLNTVITNNLPATGLALSVPAAAIPEPGSIVLALVGLLGLGGRYLWGVVRSRQHLMENRGGLVKSRG